MIEAQPAEDTFQIGVATQAFEQETGDAGKAKAIVLCVLSQAMENAAGLCDLL